MQVDMAQLTQNAEQAEAFLKLLANKNRLMILCTLQQEELSVTQLNNRVPLAQSALSQHLASLRKSGLVSTRREAQTIYYRVEDPRVAAVLSQLYQFFCQGS